MGPIVIIGSGLAGYNAARELRKLDQQTPLAVFSADSAHFYSKPMLSNALASGKTPVSIPMNTSAQMASQLNAVIRAHTRVTALDPAQHAVRIGDETVNYSKLVLALGAHQIRLALSGSAADVYALGDCAEVEGLVLPFVMPIMHAARALAAILAGKPTPVTYPAMPVLVKTPACPTIVSPPLAGAAGSWSITADDESVNSLFCDAGGKLLGFALNGKATAERAALTQQLPAVLA